MKNYVLLTSALFLFTIPLFTYSDISSLEGNASISIENKVTNPGDTVLVAVTATGFHNIGSFDCQISFNNIVLDTIDLSSTVVNIHPNIAGATHNVLTVDNNISILALTWFSMQSASIPDGEKLFDLQFIFCNELYSCAQNGTSSFLDFVEDATHFTTEDFIELPLDYTNGSISGIYTLKVLKLDISGEGQVLVDDSLYVEPVVAIKDTPLMLEAIPETDWTFDGWSGDITETGNPTNVIMNDHKNITVTFSVSEPEQYILTIDITGQGDVTVDDEVYIEPLTFTAGSTVTLEALPDEWWEFSGWADDVESVENPIAITIDYHKNITAHFDLINFINRVTVENDSSFFRVYPNPVKDIFSLVFNDLSNVSVFTVEIYNMHGEIIYTKQVSAYQPNRLSLASQPSGVYFIRVITESNIGVQYVIKTD